MTDLPEFITKRLLLRAVTEADAPAYTAHFVDYEVIRHLSSKVPWPYPDNGVQSFIQSHILPNQGRDRWTWGIHLRQDPIGMVGAIELWRPGTPENRGFWLGRQFWGRGLMTEALKPVMDHAFDTLGFEMMVLANAKKNIRSARIKEKNGARLVRVDPATYVDPSCDEQEVWELTRDDWCKNQD